MEKECNSCKYISYESADSSYPYPSVYCAKGHWDGISEEKTKQFWNNCTDFEEHTKQSTHIESSVCDGCEKLTENNLCFIDCEKFKLCQE